MKSVHTWFEQYGVSHQNPVNKQIHWVCVPLIYWSVYALLSAVPNGPLPDAWTWGLVVMALGQAYYLVLSPSLALGLLAFNAVVVLTASGLADLGISLGWAGAVVFVLAWIGQFIGHRIEGAKPSFFEDVQFLMIGPAWLMGFVYRRLGYQY
ncbi:MAG: Mpo1-like protein [Pseudomonadota bacterium]